jgi:hypothetical protein
VNRRVQVFQVANLFKMNLQIFRSLNYKICQKVYLVQPIVLLCLLSAFPHQNTEIRTHPTENNAR